MNFEASCVTKQPKFLPIKQCHLEMRGSEGKEKGKEREEIH
jgi:hypothetical protein